MSTHCNILGWGDEIVSSTSCVPWHPDLFLEAWFVSRQLHLESTEAHISLEIWLDSWRGTACYHTCYYESKKINVTKSKILCVPRISGFTTWGDCQSNSCPLDRHVFPLLCNTTSSPINKISWPESATKNVDIVGCPVATIFPFCWPDNFLKCH